jgi:prepilin-type N-terminal cleavage/methylation domain-containing protein
MMPARRWGRSGLTLVELLVAMTVTAIVGAALIQIILAQNRSAGTNEAWRVARSVARGSLNRLLADFRIAEAEGVLDPAAAMSSQSITLRVPFAIGVACNTTVPLTASLLPIDNTLWAASLTGFAGFAWRDEATGTYRYRTTSTTVSTVGPAVCSAAGIATLPASAGGGTAGRVVQLGAPSMGNTVAPYTSLVPTVGMNVLLLQQVRYRFAPSVALPGATALWREVLSGTPISEELAAPFDSTARFRFYVTGSSVAQDAVPSPRSLTRGIEIHLDGLSESAPLGSAAPKRVGLTTSIFFKNRRD